jgi:hypothetical protein
MWAETLQTVNSLNTEETLRIPLPHSDNLPPGDNFKLSLKLHAESVGEQELCLLFIYREVCVSHVISNILHLAPSYRMVRSHSKPLSSLDTSQFILFSKQLQRHNPTTLQITCFFSI